jgi:hypothetical protein
MEAIIIMSITTVKKPSNYVFLIIILKFDLPPQQKRQETASGL